MKENKINKRNYTVYMHIAPSGKRYIGVTSMPVEKRWQKGKGYQNQIFYHAIQKYGWNNLKHEILFQNLTREEAEQKEIELIAFYDTTNRNKGYNIAVGGNCNADNVHMARAVKQYTRQGVFVKEYESVTEASLQTSIHQNGIAECCRNELKTAGNYLWRYAEDEITEEYIKWCNIKDTEFCHGRGNAFVCQYTKDNVFIAAYPSIKEAQRTTGINRNSISSACKGVKEFAGGYRWEYQGEIPNEYKKNWDNRKHILQYSLDGNFIEEYNNAEEASLATGVRTNYIQRCCSGDKKSFGGFIWRYTSDIQDPIVSLFPTLSETA